MRIGTIEPWKDSTFTVEAVEWSDKPIPDDPPAPYTWDESTEDSETNRRGYMEYLNNPDNIALPKDTKLMEASSDEHLLSGNLAT